MDAVTLPILIGALLILVSALSSLISYRIGAPLLLVFLCVGLVAGEDGLGLQFADASLAYLIGGVALAVILFESGFETPLSAYRLAAAPAIVAATLGVLLTAGLLGALAVVILNIPWLQGLLLGAIVASTDAAAVFFLLRVGGIRVRDRVRSALEIESGTNDPMAIFLTIALVDLIALTQAGGDLGSLGDLGLGLAGRFAAQMGGGLVAGVVGGRLLRWAVNALRMEPGLTAVFTVTGGLVIFAATATAGGSGFLAAYVAGLTVGAGQLHGATALKRFHDGLTWLSQMVMFVALGLFATPSQFPAVLGPGLALGLLLVFVVRPAALWICLAPFRFSREETTFLAWVGLRGAVSILLALVPILHGLPLAQMLFNVTFLIVLVSLLVQGWTVSPVARRLGLIVPGGGPTNRLALELPGQAAHELVTYTIRRRSPVASGQRVPRWARPSLILRDGRVHRYHQIRGLEAGDLVYLFATPESLPLLDRLYAETHEITDEDRAFFGDMAVKADVTLGVLAESYGLPLDVTRADWTLSDLFVHEVRHPEVGDRLRFGAIELVARATAADDGSLTEIGLVLDPPRPKARPFLLAPPREVASRLWRRCRKIWRG
jgi:cell volume regulation protein A